jgi:sec-independent protein translocase protein TatA
VGPIGVQEMIAIFIVALVLFGPKKLPELGRTLGKALSEFRRAKNELKNTLEGHLTELEREARLSDSSGSTTSYSHPSYPQPYEDYGRRSYETDVQTTSTTAPAVPESAPVAGSVPRSNGNYSGRTAAEEDSAL